MNVPLKAFKLKAPGNVQPAQQPNAENSPVAPPPPQNAGARR